MLVSVSSEVPSFEELTLFDAGTFSVLSERCEENLQDEEFSKRCAFLLIGKFYFLEG